MLLSCLVDKGFRAVAAVTATATTWWPYQSRGTLPYGASAHTAGRVWGIPQGCGPDLPANVPGGQRHMTARRMG